MSKDKIKIKLVYKQGEFAIPTQSDLDQPSNIFVEVDTKNERIIIQFPVDVGLIDKRTVERRIKSIAKSGYHHQVHGRIGVGFLIETSGAEDKVPDVLLQAGHGYQREGGTIFEDQGTSPAQVRETVYQDPITTQQSVSEPQTKTLGDLDSEKNWLMGKLVYDQIAKDKTIIIRKVRGSITIDTMNPSDKFEV